MRVISGAHKGRRLLAGRHDARPTSGRVKEALFSILGSRLPGASFLDLYAGTGAIGIEAVSRGATRVVFVESDPRSWRVLNANLEHCGITERTEVYKGDVQSYLRKPVEEPFTIVFADPPYREDSRAVLLPSLSRSAMIAPHTIVILEHPTKLSISLQIGRLSRTRLYRYGDTSLSLFSVASDGEVL